MLSKMYARAKLRELKLRLRPAESDRRVARKAVPVAADRDLLQMHPAPWLTIPNSARAVTVPGTGGKRFLN